MSIFPWSSNSLASGLTIEDAVLSGLYEVIERDAWSCWEHQHRLYGMPFSALVEDTIPFSSTKNLIEKIKTAGLDLIINPLETDLAAIIVTKLPLTVQLQKRLRLARFTSLVQETILSRIP